MQTHLGSPCKGLRCCKPVCCRASVVTHSARRVAEGSFLANILSVGSAFAITSPSLDDLRKYQEEYESAASRATASVQDALEATSSVASDVTGSVMSQLPSSSTTALLDSGVDPTPLLAGLAVGIAIAAGAIALIFNSKGSKVQGISAAKAVDVLASNESAVLVDIRNQADIRESGSPDLRSVRKPTITLTYMRTAPSSGGTVVLGWPDKYRRLRGVNEESTVILLSSFPEESIEAAKLAAEVYPDHPVVYYVNGGTEGDNGWKASGLPWREPVRFNLPDLTALKSLDFTGVAAGTEKIVRKYQESPTVVNGAVAAVAVAAASVFLFTEMEAILELVGVVAALQFLASKLLFADDRQKTFQDLKSLIVDKIAANEAGSDLKQLASTILDVDNVDQVQQVAVNASNGASGVPVNVQEARQWINNWKAKQRSNVLV